MAARMTGDQRRSQLLETARQVFSRQGYHGTSMDAVAEAAGITKPVLYQHFASKRDLYLELLDEMATGLRAAVDGVSPELPPEERLRQGMRAYFRFVERNEAAFRLLFEGSASDPEVAKRVQGTRQHIAERTAYVIREQGSKVDPEVAAWAVVGMAELVSHWWLDHPSRRSSADELADQVALLARYGVSASR